MAEKEEVASFHFPDLEALKKGNKGFKYDAEKGDSPGKFGTPKGKNLLC